MLRGSSSGQRQAASSSAFANIDKKSLTASRDLARGLNKCYKQNQVPAQATASLKKCVKDYEPRLEALSAKLQALPVQTSADRNALEEARKKLDEAFDQITAANKLKLENNMVKFSGTALAQIFKAVQGGQAEPMVIDECDNLALCAPLAGALQDFRQDLQRLMADKEASKQEAIQDAVAKAAEEKQKAAAQADQEKAQWMEQNSELQSQLHATNLREIAARRSLSALKQDLCAARQHVGDSVRDVPVLQQLADQHAADLKVFFHDQEQRVEDADVLQQTLRTQLSAETERALSTEARVTMLDLDLKESRAKVAKLAAQVENLEHEQGAKHEAITGLTDEGQELKEQVAAQQCTLNRFQADEKARHLATLQDAAKLKGEMIAQHQAELAAAEEALAAEKVAHGSAVTSLKAGLDLAQQEASSLQNQLKALESQLAAGKQAFGTASHTAASFPLRAAQQQAAAETQAHEEADWRVPSYQTPVQSAQQVVFALRTKLEAMQQELTEKAADETVNWAVSSLLDDMQAAQQQLSVGVSMQQAHQAGSPTAADLQLDWADSKTQCLQEGANGSLVEEEQGEQAGAGAVAGLGHQVAGLGHQVEEAAQRRPSPLQTPLPSPLQTPLPSPLQSPLPSPFQVPLPSPLQELRSSVSKMHEVREGRPEADDHTQLKAAMRLAHSHAAPQDEPALEEEMPRGQAKHDSPIAPFQQETPGRDTAILKDKHGVQQEVQHLRQELLSTKTALQLSQDRLQEQGAAIDSLQAEAEVTWQQMNGRHDELLQQMKSLKASLRRAGAHDEEAYRNDIQEYNKCCEVFDRYGDPVRLAQGLEAMWPQIGLPPPTDPRLVKSVVHLNMQPEELAFHVPWYGLVTTGNCKQIMLLLEDRHGDTGVDNQDLDLTLLRAAQSVWVAANLIPWAHHKKDLNHKGPSGRPTLSPVDQRRLFTVIRRDSLEDPAPLFKEYLAGMMDELKQADWRSYDDKTQEEACCGCGAEWDDDLDDNGQQVGVHLQVVNLHCPTCARYHKDGQLCAGDYALCVPCAQKQAQIGECPRADGQSHKLPVTRTIPQFFLKDAANAPPEKKCTCCRGTV
ncbi:TPA: hypothetical protein ACH3X3_015102 [Trebouxia sp. C0006]